jgi:PAS domain-containing protein
VSSVPAERSRDRVTFCERLRCGACGEVFTARAPAEAQGPKYADSAASMLALLRYGAGMPLNRLARLQKNWQTPVPATTQWEVVRDRADALRPVHDELARRAGAGQVLHNDDTHAAILELMGKRRAQLLAAGELPDPERTGLFTTGVVAQTEAGPIALSFTGRKHAGENLASLLSGRDALGPPVQMCDGLARNLPGNHAVVLGNCLAHGRRHVVDELENFPAECRHVLEQLRIVFRNEARCRKLGLTPEQRLELHRRDSGPVMEALRLWLEAQFEQKRVEPNSGLGKAFRYLLARWGPLTLLLRVAGAPLDNNICERALKMAIRHRNNSLFYRSERGAAVGDLYMALIHTAELHGENAFDYLTTLFEHERDLAADPASWLPWTYRATLAALAARPAA